MNNQDFTTVILVDQTQQEAFDAINNVRGWWLDDAEGSSQKLDDEFAVRFWDVHYSKQRLIEVIPGAKVVWLVTDGELNFVKDKSEWIGTKISFEVSKQDNQTQIRFTHHGLAPANECYRDCSNAWGGYISNSLHSLITTGKGQPTHIER